MCRKPLPGLLLTAAADYGIDLKCSVMVGDRWRDIVAGQKAGSRTVWIKYAYDEPEPPPPIGLITGSLAEAAEWIIKGAEE
jgi:D-glycero-D-manno-heptose 1,7-bisphosphate phosphatase